MITRRQRILLGGVIVIFALDIICSWCGALFCDGFVEANPLYTAYIDQPALFLAALTLPKAGLTGFFVAATAWFNRIPRVGTFAGDIASSTALTIQITYGTWLLFANAPAILPALLPVT
jgi:hypothetical protein